MQRSAMRCSPPVSSEVSPKKTVPPAATQRSTACDVVGQEPSPEVVSDSPHLMDIIRSPSLAGSRPISDASCKKIWATRAASAMTWRSPLPSIEKEATGLPDLAIPLATRSVHFGSIPMTTTAATFPLSPVPIRVRNVNSKSSPN